MRPGAQTDLARFLGCIDGSFNLQIKATPMRSQLISKDANAEENC